MNEALTQVNLASEKTEKKGQQLEKELHSMQTHHRQLQQWCVRMEEDFLHSQHALQRSNEHAQQQLEQSHTALESQIIGIKDTLDHSLRLVDDSWHNVLYMANYLEKDIVGSSLAGLRRGESISENFTSIVTSENMNSGDTGSSSGQQSTGKSDEHTRQQGTTEHAHDMVGGETVVNGSKSHGAILPQLEQMLTSKIAELQQHRELMESLLHSVCDANSSMEKRLDFLTNLAGQQKRDNKEVLYHYIIIVYTLIASPYHRLIFCIIYINRLPVLWPTLSKR